MPEFEPDSDDDGPGPVRSLEELAALRDDLHRTSAFSSYFLTVPVTQPPVHATTSICRRYMFMVPPLSYLGFLEEECAAYVTMTNIDSPVWNPVRERLLEALAQHIDGKRPQYISQKLE